MFSQITVPIAEHFIAPQGEGIHTGTLMLFIRLAGCSVGKPWTAAGKAKEQTRSNAVFTVLPNHEMCTLFDGRTFCCDTDYKVKEQKTIKELVELIATSKMRHVCITGGEPLLHADKIVHLIAACGSSHLGITFHLETSGTISLDKDVVQVCISELIASGGHITVSPKMNYLDKEYSDLADEAKILVDGDFDFDKLPPQLIFYGAMEKLKVYLQPINGINDVALDNLDKCLALQKDHPWLRLSLQAHKLWHTR